MTHTADNARNREVTLALESALRDVFVGTANEALRSIVEGSELTGAAGQPVDTGFLRASWQVTFDGGSATIGSNAAYAEPIEDGTGKHGPLTLRSKVGGFHSVKTTVANFDRIVIAVKDRIAKAGPHA